MLSKGTEEYPHCQPTRITSIFCFTKEFTTGCHSSVYLNEDLIPRSFPGEETCTKRGMLYMRHNPDAGHHFRP